MESGSSATDSVTDLTDLTDVTDRWNQQVRQRIRSTDRRKKEEGRSYLLFVICYLLFVICDGLPITNDQLATSYQ
jgi:hypothetical protein